MATQFDSTALEGMQYNLTSNVSEISASTDKDRIDVSLSCENGRGDEPETFYATSLYAYNGRVQLDDVGALVEEYFRMRDKVADTITIAFDDVSMDVHFLYCEYTMPPSFMAEKNFFLAATAQRVHQDSIVAIATVNHGSAYPFVIKAVGHAAGSDDLAVVEQSVQKDFNAQSTVYFNVSRILQWALGQSENPPEEPLRDVLYFSIEYFGLQKMCYIVPAAAYLTFSFRNCFNVMEYIDVAGVMTTKTDVSRDVAVCRGQSKQYDRNVERSYQVQTESLTADEVHIFEQFLASHAVNLSFGYDHQPVIITDQTCEPSSSDESLTTVKFTWRFADYRPRVFDSRFDGIMPVRSRVFDDTFSPEYD